MALKLHILGYHDWHGGLSVSGGINPNCGFHCPKCGKSWLPNRSGGRVILEEVLGHQFHRTDLDHNREGWVHIGRMTMKELLAQLNNN